MKKCPLKYSPGFDRSPDCLEEECAWWNGECIIDTIARSLMFIQEQLFHIAKK